MSRPDLSSIFPFVRPDGSREFICTDCSTRVYMPVDVEGGGLNICHACRYIGEHPHLPDEVKALLRGDFPEGGRS